ncbi:putative 18S rRNA (guanine-N(7))-methyltransferase [Acropora cervicornis]|uniref:18S rRNA (Guanine-N(7))-methyltransferase n=1 Tax=Acropora cervicornis TaxID=6130 RepID=A0AAD9QBH5_ACRCE|nr:putative 18S rRNA (guanine-N(7))-methyltransferase [Acropora cervicornis]
MASGRRPEHQAPPEVFYNEDEARKYTSNSRMIEIQVQLSQRSVELLNLPEDKPCFLLDIGFDCLILDSTDVAIEREVEGDLFHHDAGQGLYFKPGTFDGCVSISALQWLCNADKKGHNPVKRLYKFFSSLYSCLSRGSRAVFQFYPENPQQVELITMQAMKAGFTGGLVVDYPNSTRAKKIFLCLFAGVVMDKLPKGLGTEETNNEQNTVQYSGQRQRTKVKRGKSIKNTKNWIKEKKERRRRQGK